MVENYYYCNMVSSLDDPFTCKDQRDFTISNAHLLSSKRHHLFIHPCMDGYMHLSTCSTNTPHAPHDLAPHDLLVRPAGTEMTSTIYILIEGKRAQGHGFNTKRQMGNGSRAGPQPRSGKTRLSLLT